LKDRINALTEKNVSLRVKLTKLRCLIGNTSKGSNGSQKAATTAFFFASNLFSERNAPAARVSTVQLEAHSMAY
jgi:hypothetical protein